MIDKPLFEQGDTQTAEVQSGPTREHSQLSYTAMWRYRSLSFLMILFIACLARLYGISNPLTEAGQERQTQVAMVARNMYRDNYSIFHTRLDLFGNEPGHIALEFPLQSFLMAIAYGQGMKLDLSGRLISISFSLGSILLMFSIALRFLDHKRALFSTAIFSLTPMAIFFGRAVYPEPLLMFFILASVLLILKWTESNRRALLISSCICASMACMIKAPVALPMCLPLAAIWWFNMRARAFKQIEFYTYFTIIIASTAAWALWSASLAPADPGWNAYQFSALARWGVPHAWFTWRFYGFVFFSIVFFVLTPIPFILSLFGLSTLKKHPLGLVLSSWIIAMSVFLFGTPGAQATHWNYQVPFIAPGALLAGLGIGPAVKWLQHRKIDTKITVFLSLAAVIGYFFLYYFSCRSAYDPKKRVPNAIKVGEIVQQHFSPNGFLVLVQPGMVATAQSYYMDRKVKALRWIDGQPPKASDLQSLLDEGAMGLVAVDTPYGKGTEAIESLDGIKNVVSNSLNQLESGPGYIIFKRKNL